MDEAQFLHEVTTIMEVIPTNKDLIRWTQSRLNRRMNSERWCDFEKLSEAVSHQFFGDQRSVHGPTHWRRVEQNGLWLAARTGADTFITRLFAWFHDSRRVNDWTDPEHGRRGAEFAASLRGTLFDLEDAGFDLLVYACEWHTDKDYSEDATIGTCWDSDRLDLGRVGTIPSANFMSTNFGKEVAHAGSFDSFLPSLEDEVRTNFES